MKGKFTIPVVVERDIDCLGCDHCIEHLEKIKKGFFRKPEVKATYTCDKLGIALDQERNLETDHMPCDAAEWQQTNAGFPISEEKFTLKFKDAELLPAQ